MNQHFNKNKLLVILSLSLVACNSGKSSTPTTSNSVNTSSIVVPTPIAAAPNTTQVALGESPKFVYDGIKLFNRFAASSFPMLNKILSTYADIFPPEAAKNHSKEYFEQTIAAIAQVQASVDKISSSLADFHQQYTAD